MAEGGREGGREGVMWFTGRAKAILREQARLIPSAWVPLGHFSGFISKTTEGRDRERRAGGREAGRARERERKGEEGLT